MFYGLYPKAWFFNAGISFTCSPAPGPFRSNFVGRDGDL